MHYSIKFTLYSRVPNKRGVGGDPNNFCGGWGLKIFKNLLNGGVGGGGVEKFKNSKKAKMQE